MAGMERSPGNARRRRGARCAAARSALLLAAACAAACTVPDKVCETDDEDNVCSGDGDCVMAFCAAECHACPKVYARRQLEEAWCLTEEGQTARSRCAQASSLDCTPGPTVCPRGVVAACEGGRCVPKQP